MNVLALLRPTSGVMPTLAPGGKTGSAANAEDDTVELAATIRATAAKYRSSFMKDLPGLHGGRSAGPTMQLGISGGILEPTLEPCGHDRDVPVGPLLAVLMSLQQGRLGHRSTGTFRYATFCGIWPGIRALFEALSAAKYRSPSAAGLRWGGCPVAAQRSGG